MLAPGVMMEQENVFLDDVNMEVEVNPDKVDAIQTPAKKKSWAGLRTFPIQLRLDEYWLESSHQKSLASRLLARKNRR